MTVESPLRVTPILRETGRYLVASGRKGVAPYLCDVNMYQGLGRCACKNWECKKWPEIREATETQRLKLRLDPDSRCKHLQQAMLFHALLEIDSRAVPGNKEQDGE